LQNTKGMRILEIYVKKREGLGMDFFEKIGETISVKGKEAVDKAKVMTDIAGLKGQIATCKRNIEKNYKDIGKAYYEANKYAPDTTYARQIKAIKNAEKAIDEFEQKIYDLKGVERPVKTEEDYYDDVEDDMTDLIIIDEE